MRIDSEGNEMKAPRYQMSQMLTLKTFSLEAKLLELETSIRQHMERRRLVIHRILVFT